MRIVGREGDLEELGRALASGRPVTIRGPRGVGKTRLAREALGPDALVCSLVRLAHRDEVIEALAATLDVARGGAPLEVEVARALSRARVVVLDGADRALDALRALLHDWKDARIVVTARSALEVDSELAFELAPLDAARSLELFIAHVPGADPALAAEIVAQLDGLPQAIEWIASRAALLGEAECLERLRARRLSNDSIPSSSCASSRPEGDAENSQPRRERQSRALRIPSPVESRSRRRWEFPVQSRAVLEEAENSQSSREPFSKRLRIPSPMVSRSRRG